MRRADRSEQGDLGVSNIFSVRANLRRLGATSEIGVLDGIRAIAILWVIAYHTTFFMLSPISSSRLGRSDWRWWGIWG